MEQDQTTSVSPTTSHSIAPMVIAFVALLVAAGAFYYFKFVERGSMNDPSLPAAETVLPDPESIAVGADDTRAASLGTQGTSDELGDIEKDLNATDMGALDDIDQI